MHNLIIKSVPDGGFKKYTVMFFQGQFVYNEPKA